MFDKMKNKDISETIWRSMNIPKQFRNINEMLGHGTDQLMKETISRESTDNLTSVLIALNGMKCHFDKSEVVKSTFQTAEQTNKLPKSIISNNNDLKSIEKKQDFINKNFASSNRTSNNQDKFIIVNKLQNRSNEDK